MKTMKTTVQALAWLVAILAVLLFIAEPTEGAENYSLLLWESKFMGAGGLVLAWLLWQLSGRVSDND